MDYSHKRKPGIQFTPLSDLHHRPKDSSNAGGRRLPVPPDFTEMAKRFGVRWLCRHYEHQKPVIERWCREINVYPWDWGREDVPETFERTMTDGELMRVAVRAMAGVRDD